jgi:putative ABC transport system permease protein
MKRSNAAFSLKAMRDLTRDKPRAILVLAVMALGLIACGTILDSRTLLSREMDRNYRETDPASASLFLAEDGREALRIAKTFPGVAEAELRERLVGRVRVAGTWMPLWIYVCPDPAATRIDKFKIENGAPSPAPGEILIERAAMGFSKARIGREIEVELPGRDPENLRVIGTAHAPGLAPAWMERIAYGFVSQEGAEGLGFSRQPLELKILSSGDRLDVDANRRLALALETELASRGIGTTRAEILPPGKHPHASQMNSLLYLLGFFGIMAFILSSVLCASTISSLMARQRRESGILRAIGASGGRIFSGYLALAFSISAFSLAISLPAARLLSIAYAHYAAGILNFTIASTAIGIAPFIAQIILGLIVPAAVTAIPLYAQSRMSVSDCLSDNSLSEKTRKPKKSAKSGKAPGFAASSLPLRNAARKPLRLAFAALAIGIGMALFLAAGSIRTSIKWTIDNSAEAQSFDIALWLSASASQEDFRSALAGLNGLDRVALAVRTNAVLVNPDGSASDRAFNATFLAPEQGIIDPEKSEGAWLDTAEAGSFVVNNLLANREGLKIGRQMTIRVGGKEIEGRISGIVKETIGFPTLYAALAPGQKTNAAYLDMKEGADIGGACAELERLLRASGFSVERISPLSEMKTAIEEHMVLITTFLSAASLMVFLVGLGAIASAIGLSVLERTREIGVLRAIGASPGRIMAMIGAEGAAMGGIGYAIALCLSIPLSMAASTLFGIIFFESPLSFRPDLGLAAAVLPFALAAGFLAALAPGFSAARKSVTQNLRYE